MKTNEELKELIDWPLVLSQPRFSGGHEEVMRSIFGDNAKVIAFYISDNYQGDLAVAYQFPDEMVAVMTDYYGSCSGCDAWDGADDESARKMVNDLVQSAKLFPDRESAARWCEHVTADEKPWQFPFREAVHLVNQILEGKVV